MHPASLPSFRCAALVTALAIAVLSLSAGVAAQEGTPPAEATEEVWFDAVIPAEELPRDVPTHLALLHVVWDEGAGYRYEEDTLGIAVNCVVAGRWAFRPDRDEVFARGDARPQLQPAPAGVETTLEPGDCALLHQNVHRAEGNAGTGPVDFVAVIINPDETQPPANAPEALEVGPMGYIDTGNWAQTGLAPAGPIRLTLQRITLAPGASLPEQTQVGDALIALREGMLGVTAIDGQPFVQRGVAFDSPEPTPATEGSETTLEAGDAAHVQPGTTITLRNSGDAPASWWLVTAEPVEE